MFYRATLLFVNLNEYIMLHNRYKEDKINI